MGSLLSRITPKVWLFLVLIVVGGVMALIEQRDQFTAVGPAPTSDNGEPDYYLEGVTFTRFNTEGAPYQVLKSPRLTHTPNDDITRAVTPELEWTNDQNKTWLGSAERGRVEGSGSRITLDGKARLHQPSSDWTLSTQTIHYTQHDSHAWSDDRSTFTRGQEKTVANRFDAWIDKNQATLNGNVTGSYPPTR
ncbi:LPS export ABC transporter periplasmic protein LptC [Larsenimonas suaedae]|uniref:LPS export ABC transporter periplasmic protein LptC n=1 Tax=Larsenimonas suaedae TaxID=1851019 RepID=A0ABU1GUK8_9GAMM|nr:LPS export ABC transporter periplasmic protein LptC [Larsenimonas suaedae]MCM2971006.1 LPS export ABC transporter periplasmic protein LptC [Larsenimonas suaedae]MDR5895715.1 LPS export ABC transporter periplasmic protein LptC [Larsenimonas suaedae]